MKKENPQIPIAFSASDWKKMLEILHSTCHLRKGAWLQWEEEIKSKVVEALKEANILSEGEEGLPEEVWNFIFQNEPPINDGEEFYEPDPQDYDYISSVTNLFEINEHLKLATQRWLKNLPDDWDSYPSHLWVENLKKIEDNYPYDLHTSNCVEELVDFLREILKAPDALRQWLKNRDTSEYVGKGWHNNNFAIFNGCYIFGTNHPLENFLKSLGLDLDKYNWTTYFSLSEGNQLSFILNENDLISFSIKLKPWLVKFVAYLRIHYSSKEVTAEQALQALDSYEPTLLINFFKLFREEEKRLLAENKAAQTEHYYDEYRVSYDDYLDEDGNPDLSAMAGDPYYGYDGTP